MPTSRPETSDHLTSPYRLRAKARYGLVVALPVLLSAPALAQQRHHPGDRFNLPLSFATAADRLHAQNHPECTCRAGGQSFQLGTQICIGNQIVRCAMDLNVTSWKSVGSACPQS